VRNSEKLRKKAVLQLEIRCSIGLSYGPGMRGEYFAAGDASFDFDWVFMTQDLAEMPNWKRGVGVDRSPLGVFCYSIWPSAELRGSRYHKSSCKNDRQRKRESSVLVVPTQNKKFFSRSHDAVIRVYDDAGSAIEMHEHAGEFEEW
jgi:hypothetical protein